MTKMIGAQVTEALSYNPRADIDFLCTVLAHARGTDHMQPHNARKVIIRCQHSDTRDMYVTWKFLSTKGKPADRLGRAWP